MSVAPFIKPIRTQGGTFYAFTSASEDLGFSFNNDDRKFRFSNYVLLDIPKIKNLQEGDRFNHVQFDGIPGAFNNDGSKSLNAYLAESFQNYALNLEKIITSDDDYDPTTKKTVSERVFFKWLKEIGAIRFRQANQSELADPSFGIHYVEEDESEIYQRVIKYIGEIDVVNNVKNKDNAYSEIYLHLPISHGRQPSILFQSIEDNNYAPNKEFTHAPADPINAPFIFGRSGNNTHPTGLDFLAHYDSKFGTYTTESPTVASAEFEYFSPSLNDFVNPQNAAFEWWFPTPKPNTYFLERDTFADPTNDIFRINDGIKKIEYVRSRLDGISLQFNPETYNDIATNPDIDSFGELAESGLSKSFNFNAALVYYDMFNPENPDDFETNLFGVLFLDNVDPAAGGGGIIPSKEKYKPNPLTGENGNAYSLKTNLKFDVTTDDVSVETTINDYNTFSLEMFMEALNELRETTRIFTRNSEKITKIEQLAEETRSLVVDGDNLPEIKIKLNELETQLNESSEIFASSRQLLSLIQKNRQEIENIFNNQTSLEIAYNLDVIKQGRGINVNRTSNQFIRIENNVEDYNIGTRPRVSIVGNFTTFPNRYEYKHKLLNYSNYLKITDGSFLTPFQLDRDVAILINDKGNKWRAGQTMRISFTNGLNMSNQNGNFNLNLFTDGNDELDTGFPYSAEIGTVTFDRFTNNNGRPTIEIVCIDPKTFDFEIDII